MFPDFRTGSVVGHDLHLELVGSNSIPQLARSLPNSKIPDQIPLIVLLLLDNPRLCVQRELASFQSGLPSGRVWFLIVTKYLLLHLLQAFQAPY